MAKIKGGAPTQTPDATSGENSASDADAAPERADPNTEGWPEIAAGLAKRIGGKITDFAEDKDGKLAPVERNLKTSDILAARRDGNTVRVVVADGRKVELPA